MRISKRQLEIIELLESFVGTNAQLLAIIEKQQSCIKRLSERVERLEIRPSVKSISRGIRPKDMIQSGNYH